MAKGIYRFSTEFENCGDFDECRLYGEGALADAEEPVIAGLDFGLAGFGCVVRWSASERFSD